MPNRRRIVGFNWPRMFAAAVLVCACFPAAAQLRQPITVEGGELRGLPGERPGVEAFKGIPFAQPPVGDLRWRPPQPVVPWKGILAADHFSPMCMQRPIAPKDIYFPGYEADSEDCLYLNVWTPAKSAKDRYPVMVWIYGGGFRQGSAAPRFYDGSDLAAKGVVLVSFNYRVGAFGFLAHPELSAESNGRGSGNYGFLDQIAALKWVHNNIAQFGGDPSNVTIFGQSAGGASSSALVISPLSKGLFNHAISESGTLICSPDIQIPLAEAERNGLQFADELHASSITEMRKIPAEEILHAKGTFHLVVDGYFLPYSGAESFARGIENKVPIIAGSNSRESHAHTTLKAYLDHVREQFGGAADDFLRLYPASNDTEASEQMAQSTIDEYAFDEWQYAKVHAEKTQSKTYLYVFGHNPPVPSGMYSLQDPGAYHGAEIAYVFDNLRVRPWPWTALDQRLADQMSSYWVNFAKTGNPNGQGLPYWPAYDPEHPMQMSFGDQPRATPVEEARFAFFEKNKSRLYLEKCVAGKPRNSCLTGFLGR